MAIPDETNEAFLYGQGLFCSRHTLVVFFVLFLDEPCRDCVGLKGNGLQREWH